MDPELSRLPTENQYMQRGLSVGMLSALDLLRSCDLQQLTIDGYSSAHFAHRQHLAQVAPFIRGSSRQASDWSPHHPCLKWCALSSAPCAPTILTPDSADASFMEWSAFLIHVRTPLFFRWSRASCSPWPTQSVWVQPLQIVIGVILLLVYLGYSALVGVAVSLFHLQEAINLTESWVHRSLSSTLRSRPSSFG